MNLKRIFPKALSLSLALIMLTGSIVPITSGATYAETLDAYSYTLSADGNATITAYDADVGGLVPSIPSVLDGHPVTDIGFQAFVRKDLTRITLPEGLLRIGAYSFEGNNIENLVIPNSVVSIGDGAFYKTQLAALVLGTGLLSIGSDAFSTNKLTTVIMPSNITSLGGNAFKFNGSNKDSESITDWVSGIGGVWHLVDSNWVKSPYSYTLSADGNATITAYDADVGGLAPSIPTTLDGHPVTDIGFQAFVRKDLTRITLPEGLLRIGAYSFEGNNIENLVIPNSVVSIGDGAFYKTQLNALVLGTGLLSIGSDAFSTSKLTTVIMPSNITSLGDNVFKFNGSNKDSESITDWVSGIGGVWHLVDSNWVKSPYLYTLSADGNATITAYDADVGGLAPLIPTTLDGHPVTDIGFQAFVRKDLTRITLPEGLLRIGAYSFEGNNIENLVIPNSVVSIGDGAFYKTQLAALVLGTGLLSIGSDAFSTSKLTTVIMPSNITSLGGNAFKFNGPNNDSESITDWVSGIGDSWNLVASTWIKASLLSVVEDQLAPVGLSTLPPTVVLTDGKIMGTSNLMEFKLNDATEYTAVTATNTLNLQAGTYAVRFKAKVGFNAGSVILMTISPFVAPIVVDSPIKFTTGYPLIQDVASTSINIEFNANQEGQIKYVLCKGSHNTLTQAQIVTSGLSLNVLPAVTNTIHYDNLTPKTDYILYSLLINNSGQVSEVVITPFATLEIVVKQDQLPPVSLVVVTPTPTTVLTDGRIDGISTLVPVVLPVEPLVVPPVTPYLSTRIERESFETIETLVSEQSSILKPEIFSNILINGKQEAIAIKTSNMLDGVVTTIFEIDSNRLIRKLAELEQTLDAGKDNFIEIPMDDNANTITVITGDVVKTMVDYQYDLIISSSKVQYRISMSKIAIETIANKLSVNFESLSDILLEIKINKAQAASLDKYIATLPKSITTFSMDSLDIEIVAKTKKDTAVILKADGIFSQTPAFVYQENGKWVVTLNPITNSIYGIMQNKKTIASAKNHWSQGVVDEMASQLILTDVTKFEPDKPITRVEISKYLIKSLGLYKEDSFVNDSKILSDVDVTDSQNENKMSFSVNYVNNNAITKDTISREEAMTMYARVMKIIAIPENNTNALDSFKDKSSVSKWAVPYVTQVINANIFCGRSKEVLAPKDALTHAEALAALRNLLETAKKLKK